MAVTVGGMDAAIEPSGTSLWRVTGVRVLNSNHFIKLPTTSFTQLHHTVTYLLDSNWVDVGIRRRGSK